MSNAKPARRRNVRWMKILMILLTVWAVTQIYGQVNHYRALTAEADTSREQLVQAEAEYTAKLDAIGLLDNEAYIEREAREKLGMVKPGEVVVSTVHVELPQADAVAQAEGGEDTALPD